MNASRSTSKSKSKSVRREPRSSASQQTAVDDRFAP